LTKSIKHPLIYKDSAKDSANAGQLDFSILFLWCFHGLLWGCVHNCRKQYSLQF